MRKNKKVGYRIAEFYAEFVCGPEIDENFNRVENILSLYRNKLSPRGSGRRPVHSTDVLRSAVVLIHATLEELLRSVARFRFDRIRDVETLKTIPLLGNQGKNASKYFLGDLIKHKDLTVDSLISQSVKEYYNTSVTYNHQGDIVRVLNQCNFDIDKFKKYLPILDEMISRRHRIVHHGDKHSDHPNRDRRGRQFATPLSLSKVEKWARVAKKFSKHLIEEMCTDNQK
jgi:hypothetical protein